MALTCFPALGMGALGVGIGSLELPGHPVYLTSEFLGLVRDGFRQEAEEDPALTSGTNAYVYKQTHTHEKCEVIAI